MMYQSQGLAIQEWISKPLPTCPFYPRSTNAPNLKIGQMQIKITRCICYLLCVNHVDFRSYESAFMPWLLEDKEQKSQLSLLF
jgi:hypothetical protein